MYTIHYNSKDQAHGFESFEETFIQICNNHRQQDRAMAFAFILYDFENHQLVKILKDQEYWDSLDALSGNYLTVFSFHATNVTRSPVGQPGRIYNNMSRISSSSFYSEGRAAYQLLFKKYFNLTHPPRFPAILFFQVDKENIIDHEVFELNERKIEDAFLELKDLITTAVDALKKISPDSKANFQEIFNQVKGNADHIRTIKSISSSVGSLKNPVNILLKIVSFLK